MPGAPVIYAGFLSKLDEDEHVEFKMHMKNAAYEFPQKYEGDVMVRQTQPLSQTICAFLNTEGGRLYIGVDDMGTVRGILMNNDIKDHYLASLSECLYHFIPPVPPELIQVGFIRVHELHRFDKGPDPEWPTEKPKDYDGPFVTDVKYVCDEEHFLGWQKCPCQIGVNDTMNRYLIVVKVLPDPKNVIYRNDEGLVFFRRHGSNKMIPIADLVTFHNTTYLDDIEERLGQSQQVESEIRSDVSSSRINLFGFHFSFLDSISRFFNFS
uniref:AlbA_2 domain-containing protein n=1 Tax=Haemonchus contortus TaxID=6289 RepID=A0A7I4YE49_HAECO